MSSGVNSAVQRLAFASRLRWRGTHTGAYSGLAPTGKTMDIMAIMIGHVVDGKVIENWSLIDQFSLFQQLGALPANLLPAQIPAHDRS